MTDNPLTPPPPPPAAQREVAVAPAIKYETRSVKTLRGQEGKARAHWETQGWEFVSQMTGVLRSDLLFRRPKPKTSWIPFAILGGVLVFLFIFIFIMAAIERNAAPAEEPAAIETTATQPTAESQDASQPAPSPSPSIASPAPAPAAVQETTVDALLDKLNSADMGGSRPGDRYHLVGQAFMRDLWFEGATGDYAVMLSAQGGAQDLPILTTEATVVGWQEGTLVDLVLEDVERTVNGETSSGWLYVVSSKVVG